MKKILVLPGLGDIHWCLLKLRDWLRRRGPEWENPELHVWDIDNRPRSIDYLDLVPWVRRGDYFRLPFVQEKKRFDDLYLRSGSVDSISDFRGFDALIGTNGNMRSGIPYARVMEGAAVDYSYGPVLDSDHFGRHQASLGPYFVLCFSGFGMFRESWCRSMPPEAVRDLVSRLRVRFPDHRFLFTGCAWDDDYARRCATPLDRYLVGETSLRQLLSLLRHSSGYVGWCGGNSILAQHLGTPTVVWWSRRYFPRHDRTGWETPHGGRSVQLVLEVEDYSPTWTFSQVASHLEGLRARREGVSGGR